MNNINIEKDTLIFHDDLESAEKIQKEMQGFVEWGMKNSGNKNALYNDWVIVFLLHRIAKLQDRLDNV